MDRALKARAGDVPAQTVHLVPPYAAGDPTRLDGLVESYRRLADVYHDILAEQSLDALLERIADTLEDLIPHDSLTIYSADEPRRLLLPVLSRDQWAEKLLEHTLHFGEGITGWAAEHREAVLVNQAHLDPRVKVVPGTPADEPEALVSIPLIARAHLKGALNMYRQGDATFTDEEFELARRFGDAAALALDNAHVRARLEHQAQTDSLTGLYNHRYFHERLRSELRRASRAHDAVSVLMLDIDDFKRVNDVHGHGAGDEVLQALASELSQTVRGSDVVCRLGGEEFAVILPSCDEAAALGLAGRLTELLEEIDLDPAGRVTVSIGIAQGPKHAMNPRELIACAEAAMMTAKARGKNQIVFFEDDSLERPESSEEGARTVRSIAHMKMLQSLSGKLNRLNDVRQIGLTIANELRSLIDYHNCRVFVVDGEDVIPIAFRGELAGQEKTTLEVLACKLGDGITGRVAQTGESVRLADAARCDFATFIPGTDPIDESFLAVPLLYGSRVIGVVAISKLGLDQFDDDDVRLLEVLAGHASVALENARLYEAERREAQSALALLEFSRELSAAAGIEEILGLVVARTAEILSSPQVSVWLQEGETGDLIACALHGYDEAQTEHAFAARYPAELARDLESMSEPVILLERDLAAMADVPSGLEHDFAIAPLLVDGGRHGCIAAARPDAGVEFGDRELRLLAGLAYQASLAITNAGNFESLEATFLSTVEALANALEANDEYTSSHARWITDLALRVGGELGLDGQSLKRLELGALFHDIGKLGIPASILSKPGRLTAEERAIIQMHPELGERIIAPIDRLQQVRPIVRSCHEHWDGSGYPDKKVAEEIPLESRIILVCDAYHAMTTDRPYRKRLSANEAFRRLEAAAGTQFDPDVVEVCLRILRDEARAA
ncbi:MAG TPA: diguanylate cyclase [Gaiellaceae bacterium]|nr:diguanylate cyclase [Gaiellaceae bacterium]